jgi:DNA-binding transcriptional LysR family regulator
VELRQLQAFAVIAEERSLRRAARRLHLGQPGLSQTVRRLEDELGVELLVRSPQGVELTAAGTELAKRAPAILASMEDAAAAVRGHAMIDVLRIGLVGGMVAAGELTGPLIAAFGAAYPRTRLELREVNLVQQTALLANGSVDVAIVRPPYDDPAIELVPLIAEPRTLLLGAEHPLAGAGEVALEEVLSHPMLELTRAPVEWNAFWHLDDLRDRPAPPTVPVDAATIDEFELALALHAGAHTVAASVPRMSASSVLVALPLPDVPPSVIAAARRRSDRRPVVLRFLEHAREFCEHSSALLPGAVPT